MGHSFDQSGELHLLRMVPAGDICDLLGSAGSVLSSATKNIVIARDAHLPHNVTVRDAAEPPFTASVNLPKCLIFRNNTAFVGAVFAGAFAFELAYDNGMDKVWDKINKGRQWKDIRHKYVEAEE
ncbi:ubiquinol-cytochrome C reductase [Neurospora crassa]|nr:ubiquinol-cytochrome C reductase [Neurospora crassa]